MVGSCTNPPTTLPAGFVPPTGILGTGCTAAETSAWGACLASPPTTDAGNNACFANISEPDGNLNTCGNCIDGTQVVPGEPIPATWGYNIIVGIFGTLGDDTSLYGVNFGPNFGGCIIGADPAGKQCGLDAMALQACELAVCLPLCAVPEADENSPTAFNDFETCQTAADKGACSKYLSAEQTDCGKIVTDAGKDPVSKCADLYNLDVGLVDGGKPTGAQQADLIGLICGGADAGF
jgi:hypothetical protein